MQYERIETNGRERERGYAGMGKKFTISSGNLDRKAVPGTGTGSTGTGGEGKNPRTPEAGRAGAGAGAGTAAGAGTRKTEEKKLPEVSVVSADAPTIPTPPEKKADKKPKKVNRSKGKKKEAALPAEQMDALIVSLSGIVAARPKCQHWQISEQEAHSVSVPLCNILDKYEVFNKIGENSDAVALVVAAVSIVLPRAMISVAQVKEEKKHARTGNRTETNVKEGKTKGSSKELPAADAGSGKRAADVPNDASDLSFLGSLFG